MVYVSYIFLIHHSFQMTPKIEIEKGQIRGSMRPLNWSTSTNSCIWKYLIQVLSLLNTIMRWAPPCWKYAGKLLFLLNSDGKISSCNMFIYLLALRFPLMKVGPMILPPQIPAQTITLPAPCIFIGLIQ